MRLAGGLMGRVGDETAAVYEVRGEHAMVSGEMGAGAWHEGAGDAGGDGAQQALGFRLGRGAATVQAGPLLVERVDAVDEEHVQVDVGSAPSRIAG